MNSKQLNFFIVQEDWKEIEEFISHSGLLYVKNTLPSCGNALTPKVPRKNGEVPFKLLITSKSFEQEIIFNPNAKTCLYEIDDVKSYLIEFITGYLHSHDSMIFHRARFYYIKSYFASNGEVVSKRDNFVLWADAFIQSFKNKFLKKYNNEKHILFTSNTIEWIKRNDAKLDPAKIQLHANTSFGEG